MEETSPSQTITNPAAVYRLTAPTLPYVHREYKYKEDYRAIIDYLAIIALKNDLKAHIRLVKENKEPYESPPNKIVKFDAMLLSDLKLIADILPQAKSRHDILRTLPKEKHPILDTLLLPYIAKTAQENPSMTFELRSQYQQAGLGWNRY